MTLTTEDGKPCDGVDQGPFEPIAVVGLGALMPDAASIEAFWQNVLDARVSIRSLPEGRWPGPINHFWKEGGPGAHTEGFTYAKIGALVADAEFDWRRWRQPPGTLPQIDPCQQWAVTVSADAIEHAGYDGESKDIDRTRTGVVFANALGGENRNLSNLRVWANHTVEVAKQHGMDDAAAEGFTAALTEGAPRVDEDTMPGELANVVSGRVANLLDLQGPNHAMDAACASSMAAVLDACRLLQTRQVDVMLAGASDRTMDPATFAKFSAIGALSPSHSSPFDARANGFVMGEGAGVLVLKRLGDAIADEDEIYGVIRGIGGSSDGRGKGITAPSQRGQIQAIARAYSQAGYEASSVELVEAHGTSTKVGDATELSTLSRLWTGVEGTGKVAVGSIKSQIGHLKAAAGIAGIMKAVMALHHRTIPPSANFETPNPTVDWSNIPFFVPTEPLDWPRPAEHPRRAGVSAFGFGGTNFHIALEGYEPDYHAPLADEWNGRWTAYSGQSSVSAPSIFDGELPATLSHEELKAIEGGVLLLSGDSIAAVQQSLASLSFNGPLFDEDPRGRRLSEALQTESESFDVNAAVRMAIVATSWAEFNKRRTLAGQAMDDKEKWGFLQAQGILLTDEPCLPVAAKTVHMYPGQGSQYVGMTADLVQRFSAAEAVWNQADDTMVEVLDGETLSSFVLRRSLSKDELKEAEHKLKQTEYTQPAMLTADLAIERTLGAFGHRPDMVAGHSLGEYAALMSSGILDMDGALRAAAARGTEMGSVEIDDKGLMASVTAPYEEVAAVLESTDGYVIAANKNSPKMTVIAGETAPVKAAMAAFEEKGFNSVALATSHAFHSRIVAPANEPLRRFLESLEIRWPSVPITANVDGSFYPLDGPDAKAGILEKLAPQMASSVEWTKQIETMYDAGGRVFVEVGPKRALTMFATQILEGRPHVPIMTNHPKQGGIASLLTAIGALALAGRPPMWPGLDSEALQDAFKAGPIEARNGMASSGPSTSTVELEALRVRARPLPGHGGAVTISPSPVVASTDGDEFAKAQAIRAYVGDRIAKFSGYPASFCHGAVDLVHGLGLSPAEVQRVVSTIASEAQTDPAFDPSSAVTAGDLNRWVRQPPAAWTPMTTVSAPASLKASPVRSVSAMQPASRRDVDPYVVSGISLGLPGMDRVFSEDAFEKLVRGETCLSEVSDEYKQRLLDKNIVRLIKGRDGSVNMDQATVFGDVPQLAGLKGAFDLAEEFGIDPKAIIAWDISTQLAVAAGLLALRDAGIPLTPVEQVGKGGLRLIRNWQVPQVQRERTGIVFSSCFPGLQMAKKHAKTDGDDGEGRFDRRYLFQTLNMGHSQFAQYTGIRGPNTTINLACASATAAFGVAEDWLDAGRVDRVVIISGDDVTGDDLWEWIAGGFAASGAAATHNVVEETALPFDRRRNGLVLGMGAAAFVVERHSEAEQRGVQPIAEFLGSTTANSAYHGTRLDVEHVGGVVNGFMTRMEQRWGINRHDIAPKTVFFSHETYTPARGGSAQSEVKALRDTFGDSTNSLVIANTKGFTGHPMAVGIEDASMFYGLKTGRIPPIANHKEKDPELGDLNLSTGGDYPELEYGLRFAAGFGSQIALSLMRRWPVEGDRVDGAKLLAWARALAGTDDVVMRVLHNKLVAYVNGEDNLHGGVQGSPWEPTAPWEGKPSVASAPAPTPVAPTSVPDPTPQAPSPSSTVSAVADADMTATVIDVVVHHTGYPADFVELDQDLEGELGIDTVKQAEIMADIRDRFSLPIDEDFVLSDYPTLNHMIGYIQRMKGGTSPMPDAPSESPVSPPVSQPQPVAEPSVAVAAPVLVDDAAMTKTVVEVVVEHTGYPSDFIELDQDLEGELGIDTVKQAEIMADIRDRFSLPIDEDFVLSDYPTLNHMIGYIQRMQQGGSPAPTPAVASPAPASPAPVVQAPTTSQPLPASGANPDIESVLVDVVVRHTGYPADFIEMDQDLEGELGIDTVKQAEIMAEIRDHFALPVDEDFVLSDHPTLNHFTAYIVKMQGGTVASEPVQAAPAAESNPSPAPASAAPVAAGTRRWQVEIEACPGVPSPLSIASGTVVVSDDGWGIAEAFCQRMEARGLEAIRIGFESRIRDASQHDENGRRVYRADPEQPEHLAWIAEQLAGVQLAGLVHMAPMKLASEQWSEDSYPSSQIALAGHGWFGLLKELQTGLTEGQPGFVASVTSLDGRHGNLGDRFNAVQCAASGVTKSFAFERPDLRCRAIDLHPDLVLEDVAAAACIESDIFGLEGEVEVGLDRDGRRWALVAFAEDVVDDVEPLTSEDTWLVSGGGSGVTAASIIGVASACQGAGAHFELLGRSSLIETTKDWVGRSEEDLSTEKTALRERLVAASDSGKVTMVEWNTAWQRFTRSRDVYATLHAIEATGNHAAYHAVNVMDRKALETLGGSLGRPITGIVHGAGLEDSKLVKDKGYEVFDRVVRVKVDGWRALLAAVKASGRDSPSFACCFTSVAGRFGNGGQTDYAAANSVLDAEMARLTAATECRAVAIGWTGWRDVGMATRGSIEAVFAAAGIETLSVDDGVSIFVGEALRGGKRRVLGCGSLGMMDAYDSFREAPLKLPPSMAATIADPARFPFIDKVLQIDEGQRIVSQCTLSTEDHPFLIDHAIEGVPYHPGVMALEMFAQNALLLRPSTCLAGFEHVAFGLPVKLLKGPMTVRVEATLEHTEDDLTWVRCRLVSDLMNSKGEVFGEREHHQATVRLVEKCDDLCPFLQREVDELPSIGTPPSGALIQPASFIYDRYFHGPRFQSHGGVLRGVSGGSSIGIDGMALMRHQLPASDQFAVERQGEPVLLEALPMLIEAGFQNAGLVAMESLGFSSLPVGISWSTMLRVPDSDESLRLRSVQTGAGDDGITVHDVLIVGEDDAPVLALKGLQLKAMGMVDEDQKFTFER